MNPLTAKPPRPPVARTKKSMAMPPLLQTSPSTPPSAQRIPATSPIDNKALLPLPVSTSTQRRRARNYMVNSSTCIDKNTFKTLQVTTRNQKRTRSSIITTPKRIRGDDLIVSVPGTPGKKRSKCTCQKRRNKICDICAAAIDA